jgi:hypothetical protein
LPRRIGEKIKSELSGIAFLLGSEGDPSHYHCRLFDSDSGDHKINFIQGVLYICQFYTNHQDLHILVCRKFSGTPFYNQLKEFIRMEEYLTVSELAARIKYSPQTLYNFIYSKKFVLGIHYIKPTGKKILFIWSAIERWLNSSGISDDNCQDNIVETSINEKTQNLINI